LARRRNGPQRRLTFLWAFQRREGRSAAAAAAAAAAAVAAAMQGLNSAVKNATGAPVSLIRQGLAELLGAFLFTFLGAGVYVTTGRVTVEEMPCNRAVAIVLADAVLFFSLLSMTMRLTQSQGGYFNPALTFALTVLDLTFDRKWFQHIMRGTFFIVAQLIGALAAAFLVWPLVPHAMQGDENLGYSRPVNWGKGLETTALSAFFIEAIMGFFLTLLILAVRRNEKHRASVLIAVGYLAMRLLSFPFNNGFVNPARSFGPAVVGLGIQYMWIYLLAAPAGALFGTAVFVWLNHKEYSVADELQEDEEI
jgi:glycerol uptake facilitator-like aquaporin